MKRPADRKDRIVAALAGKPLDPTRLRASAAAASIEGARQAAKRAGLPPIDGERALALHRKRESLASVVDRLAEREVGGKAAGWERGKFAEAYVAAGYRRATHAHTQTLAVHGAAPVASGDTGRIDPSAAGLPRAYAKQGYSVTTSSHTITAPAGWLRRVYLRGAALIDGRLVLELAPDPDPSGAYAAAWVEQGRGTAIRLERGHVVQRGGVWAFARKRRAA